MDGGMEGGKEGWMEGYYLIPFICDPKVVKLQTAVVRSWGGGGCRLMGVKFQFYEVKKSWRLVA